MDKLKFIKKQMDLLAVPYEFGEWASKIQYPYFVGEITEEPVTTESGLQESTMILTGFTRGKYIAMEKMKDAIKAHFHPVHSLVGQTESGAIVVFFDGAFYIPTGEADLKRIQINLKIKEWKVK